MVHILCQCWSQTIGFSGYILEFGHDLLWIREAIPAMLDDELNQFLIRSAGNGIWCHEFLYDSCGCGSEGVRKRFSFPKGGEFQEQLAQEYEFFSYRQNLLSTTCCQLVSEADQCSKRACCRSTGLTEKLVSGSSSFL